MRSGKLVVTVKYAPHDKQRQFHDSKAKYRALIGGVGSGKSLGGVMEALNIAVKHPGTKWAIIAPSYRMLKDATMVSFFEFCPKEVIKEHIKGEKKIILINNSEIWYRSADDPESLRGPNLNGFFMDEAALCKEKTWKIMLGRCRRPGPNIAWIATTPRGYNWVWKLWVKEKREKQLEEYDIIKCSSQENPYLPDDFTLHLERTYTGEFYMQEVLGEFTAHEGLVYKDFKTEIHEKPIKEWKERYVNNLQFVGGIDWGYSNPMAAVIGAVDNDGRLHIAGEVYKRQMTIEEFAARIRETENVIAADLGLSALPDVRYVADPSDVGLGTGSLMNQLRSKGFDIQKADNTVMSGISAVSARLQRQGDGMPRLYVDPRCVNLLNEFGQYSYEEREGERPHKDKPIKVNDHAMDALRYTVMDLRGGDVIVSLGGGDVLF